MASAYEYNSLPTTDSIRLFRLQPGSGDTPIEGNLTTTFLSDSTATALKFKALSYTWSNPLDEGNPSYKPYDVVQSYILCDQRRMKVTENLYDALWQLRELKDCSPLWIDAVCINQAHDEEINHQLKLMSRVYADASSVIIWLGKEDSTTHEAIDVMEKNGDSLITNSLFDASNAYSHSDYVKWRQSDSITGREQHAVANLLLRTWFSRLWTLQEVLLPERTISFCGSRQVDISCAAILAGIMLRNDQKNGIICESARPSHVELATSRLGAAASVVAWMGCTLPAGGFGSRAFLRYPKVDSNLTIPRTFKWLIALEFLVHESRQRECSDAKDKIIAPLAFAMHGKFVPDKVDFLRLEKDIQSLRDCSLSTQELYCKFTRFMINSMANLDILSRAHRTSNDQDDQDTDKETSLPSWVPPFHTAGSSSLIDELLFTKYDAAKHMGTRCEGPSTEFSELRVRAIIFGKIYKISKYAVIADTIPSWFSSVQTLPGYHENGSSHDIASTTSQILGDRLHQGRDREKRTLKNKQEFLICNLSSLLRMQLNTQVTKGTRRRLFWSYLGQRQLIGLAPELSQECDCICILQGAKVPFVVRETTQQGRFGLVGEAFVENVMHGELEVLNFSEQEIVFI